MSNKADVKKQIVRIRLVKPHAFGREANVLDHLDIKTFVDHRPISILFAADPRFIRVELTGDKDEREELIPLSNIAGITLEPVPPTKKD